MRLLKLFLAPLTAAVLLSAPLTSATTVAAEAAAAAPKTPPVP